MVILWSFPQPFQFVFNITIPRHNLQQFPLQRGTRVPTVGTLSLCKEKSRAVGGPVESCVYRLAPLTLWPSSVVGVQLSLKISRAWQ